ncbi:Lysine 2,3-aminomutase [hydrothermal vent metagenome]|uniref:Lysine 2,3-aminomutase n=1 Tax=hydrothermal vent metagenome TaxID=652676 RepID=A0A1W1CDR8_9ZZZZ
MVATLHNNITHINPILQKIIEENEEFINFFYISRDIKELKKRLNRFILLKMSSEGVAYYAGLTSGQKALQSISWQNYGAIRLLDYIDNDGLVINDQNLKGKEVISQPITTLYELLTKEKRISNDFLYDMLYLLRQFNGTLKHNVPSKERVLGWMDRHFSGLEPELVAMRAENKKRIIKKIIEKMDSGEIHKVSYSFDEGMSFEEKYSRVESWWEFEKFHMRFAFRDPDTLNEMLDYSIDAKTMQILKDAQAKGIPIFANPHYTSLLLVNPPQKYRYADQAIRSYLFASRELVDEFGDIVAWEKEDIVKPNEPNAAGWILPEGDSIHRRYPEVAIFIPKTRGRTCGGLCVSCQRMYGFQKKQFDFDLDALEPKQSWSKELPKLLEYFEKDSQLRDILITGGDALMNSDKQLKEIFDNIYEMAERKFESNKNREKKYALMSRIRLGSRLLVFIPQRITNELIEIMREFRERASKIGFKQFIVQTHFESAIEITPEVKKAVDRILSVGWIVTNQNVFTPAVSVRGHTAYLREALNDIGILPYYTFSVKGFKENSANFSNNARTAQEVHEEKVLGAYSKTVDKEIAKLPSDSSNIIQNIDRLRKEIDTPFLATDRNVMNLPAVGKSLTFRTIGISDDGRRILEFDHDHNRKHSPIIDKLGKIKIIESKSIKSYLNQIEEFGEDILEYKSIWGYSIFETEKRTSIYKYPKYDYEVTDEIMNFSLLK